MTRILAESQGLPDDRIENLLLAAWFHDTGHSVNYYGHEYYSAEIAAEELAHHNLDKSRIQAIRYLILATNPHIDSSNPDEDLIKDADLHYLGGDQYFPLSNELRKEWATVEGRTMTERQWYEQSLAFFKRHRWLTEWAVENLTEGKSQNQQEIECRLAELT